MRWDEMVCDCERGRVFGNIYQAIDFAYIDQQIDYPTLLLYFTDGMGTYPKEEPGYDVMWIMPKERGAFW